jgi:hypothetical protein
MINLCYSSVYEPASINSDLACQTGLPNVLQEVSNNRNGTAPHSAWRNYDDLNEYFWLEPYFSSPLILFSNNIHPSGVNDFPLQVKRLFSAGLAYEM